MEISISYIRSFIGHSLVEKRKISSFSSSEATWELSFYCHAFWHSLLAAPKLATAITDPNPAEDTHQVDTLQEAVVASRQEVASHQEELPASEVVAASVDHQEVASHQAVDQDSEVCVLIAQDGVESDSDSCETDTRVN